MRCSKSATTSRLSKTLSPVAHMPQPGFHTGLGPMNTTGTTNKQSVQQVNIMPITASVGGGTRQDPISAGSHHAICYGVVAIGTQPSNDPKYKPKKKVVLMWELPQERGDYGEKKNVPRVISKRYTLTMNPKGTLRPDLESWRGKPFSDTDAAKFDIGALIGANCFVNIVHQERGGATYANIAAIMPLAKGMNKMTNESPSLLFNLEDAINEAFMNCEKDVTFPANLHPWLVEDCKKSEEYQSFIGKVSKPAAAAPIAKQANLDTESVPF